MTKDDIFEKIKEILIKEFEIDGDLITPTASLFVDLDFDSIDAVDLIVKIKPYVSGKIDPELFENIRTIQDVVNVLFPLVQEVP
ncbi:acyl carrier protein [Treponema primitia]|uniref:acyl carrier protein n=1 Tax=Treponema primitia TaxID=88058 RepID=UPI00397EF94A